MDLKIRIDKDTIYSLPLTKNQMSPEAVQTFEDDVALVNGVLTIEKPGVLTFEDVRYSVYERSKLESTVPKGERTVSSRKDQDNKATYKTQKYTVDPIEFSNDESQNLVEILRVLATYSHTHSSKDSAYNVETSVKRLDSKDYHCAHCSHQAHWGCGNHCDNKGNW